MTKRGRPTKAKQEATEQRQAIEPQKNAFEKKFGEGTAFAWTMVNY